MKGENEWVNTKYRNMHISEINNEKLSSLNMNSKILDDYTLAWNSFEAIEEFYFNFLP